MCAEEKQMEYKWNRVQYERGLICYTTKLYRDLKIYFNAY